VRWVDDARKGEKNIKRHISDAPAIQKTTNNARSFFAGLFLFAFSLRQMRWIVLFCVQVLIIVHAASAIHKAG